MSDKQTNREECIAAVKDWLKRQPHLPQNVDDLFLKRFVSCSNSSLEKCKTLIDLNFTLRSQAPEIFDNRDPNSEGLINIFKVIDFCPLPKLTEKKHKVFIYRVCDSDPDKFMFADTLKAFFMVADVRLCKDPEETEGEIPIFDMAGTSLRHLTKITLLLVKKYMVYSQESHPIRLRQIHVMNIAPFLDKCMALVRPFLKSEVAQLLHFHSPNSTTLFDHISPDLLPEEYGGTLPVTMDAIKKEWYEKVVSNRELYLDDTKWKVDEAKRQSSKNSDKGLFGFQGSFRSLSID